MLRLRKQLVDHGLDAGAHTLALAPARNTISTTCRPRRCGGSCNRHGQIVPAPNKRPRPSYLRFEAELPNQMWQTDFTHYRLAAGALQALMWRC